MQATVVSKMLEQVGLTVELQMLDAATYNAKTNLSRLDQPPEQQPWDIALRSTVDVTGARLCGSTAFRARRWETIGSARRRNSASSTSRSHLPWMGTAAAVDPADGAAHP